MKIQPNTSGRPGRTMVERVSRNAPGDGDGARIAGDDLRSRASADEVRGPSEAQTVRSLFECRPAPSLTTGRLREVLDGVAGGFYDTPEVIDAVVQRLSRDL